MLRISQVNSDFLTQKYCITVTGGYIPFSPPIFNENGELIQEEVRGMDFTIDENNQVFVATEEERDRILAQLTTKEYDEEGNEISSTTTAVVEELTLYPQQNVRLAEVQELECSLDDVKYYVENGSFPTGKHTLLVLQNKKQQEMINDLQLALAELMGI